MSKKMSGRKVLKTDPVENGDCNHNAVKQGGW